MGLYFNIALFLPFNEYENKEIILNGYIIEKNYNTSSEYIVVINKFDKYKLIKNIKIKLYCKNEFDLGDRIVFKGSYVQGEVSRNYKGFNYRNYLKQSGIFGIVNLENESDIKLVNKENNIDIIISKIKFELNGRLSSLYEDKYIGFMQSLLLGYKNNLDIEVKDLFKENSISHILAISGMHVGIILITVDNLLEKSLKNKKLKYEIEIIFLILFYIITGMQVSCFRSVLFNVINIYYKLKFDKNDIVKTVIFTYIILIALNVYNIINIGLYLSFLSSISIMLFNNFFNNIIKLKSKILSFFKSDVIVSISAQILIFPIMVYSFNFFSFNFIITNIIVSLCIGWILKLGYLTLIIDIINVFQFRIISDLNTVLAYGITTVLKVEFFILEKISKIKFWNVSFKTPSFIIVVIWYVAVGFIIFNFRNNVFKWYKFLLSRKKKRILFLGVKELKLEKIKRIIFLKFKNTSLVNKIFTYIILILIIILIINNIWFYFNQNGFRIFFIDVGQGDCSLVKTNSNKTILIDSGEGMSGKSDKGKNVVYPYLLDRKINKIDYVIISHFDSDHVGGMIYILENMKVDNVVIGIQNEDSNLYRMVLEIVEEKDINLIVIDNPKIMKIDNIKITFLWPIKDKMISENKLNNNSLVFKLEYKNVSVLFTGDIEIPAEKIIVEEYKDKAYLLESDILKVGHHGSNTSTTEEFLKLVNPRFAVIGVGKNNNFNHPNDEVIDRLNMYDVKIYRTDLDGEIVFYLKNHNFKFKKMINN